MITLKFLMVFTNFKGMEKREKTILLLINLIMTKEYCKDTKRPLTPRPWFCYKRQNSNGEMNIDIR